MVPPLVTARRRAPSRARSSPPTRSHTIRGRSSPNSSLGYRPASRSSTFTSRSSVRSAKLAHRRTNLARSSTEDGPTARWATICWARTSSGLRRYRVDSMSPSCIRRVTTAASTRSPRCLGKMYPRLGSPTWWPARPMRCRPLLTAPGDSTWITRSTAPMSMPSSRLEVATSPRSAPRFSWSSMTTRCSRASEPWWALTSSPASPTSTPSVSASSFSRAAIRSARRRALQKMIVERWARTSSRIRG